VYEWTRSLGQASDGRTNDRKGARRAVARRYAKTLQAGVLTPSYIKRTEEEQKKFHIKDVA